MGRRMARSPPARRPCAPAFDLEAGVGPMHQAAIAGLAAAAALATFYDVAFGYSLCWDDVRAIHTNNDVVEVLRPNRTFWDGAGKMWLHDFWGDDMATAYSHKSYRPLTVLTFRLDAWRGGLAEALLVDNLHRTNLLLHCLCSACLGYVALALDLFPRSSRYQAASGALAAGLLFAVHPVHTEAVAGLVGRADLLSGIFFCLAVLSHAMQRPVATVALAFIGTLCKENCLTVLGVCATLEILPLFTSYLAAQALVWDTHGLAAKNGGRGDYAAKPTVPSEKLNTGRAVDWKPSSMRWGRIVWFAIAVIGFMVIRLALHQGAPMYKWTALENQIALEPDWWRRVVSYAHTHARYAALLVWPEPLAFDHGLAAVQVLSSASLLSVVAYAVVGLVVSWAAYRADEPVLKCVVTAAIPFVPASNVLFPIGTTLAERLLYVPSIGFCLFLGVLFARALGLVQRRLSSENARVVEAGMWAGLVAVLAGMLAHSQANAVAWKDDLALYEHGVEKEPLSVTALSNLGFKYMNTDDRYLVESAYHYLHKAVWLYPAHNTAWHNLGVTYSKLDRLNESVTALEQAVKVSHGPNPCNLISYFCSQLHAAGRQERLTEVLAKYKESCDLSVEELKLLLGKLDGGVNESRPRPAEVLDQVKRLITGLKAPLDSNDVNALLQIVFDAADRQQGVSGSDSRDLAAQLRAMGIQSGEDMMAQMSQNERTLLLVGVNGWLVLHEHLGHAVKYTYPNGTETSGLRRSIELLEFAEQLAPTNGLTLTNLGWAHMLAGENEQARAYFERVLSLEQAGESLHDRAKINLAKLDNAASR